MITLSQNHECQNKLADETVHSCRASDLMLSLDCDRNPDYIHYSFKNRKALEKRM